MANRKQAETESAEIKTKQLRMRRETILRLGLRVSTGIKTGPTKGGVAGACGGGLSTPGQLFVPG